MHIGYTVILQDVFAVSDSQDVLGGGVSQHLNFDISPQPPINRGRINVLLTNFIVQLCLYDSTFGAAEAGECESEGAGERRSWPGCQGSLCL